MSPLSIVITILVVVFILMLLRYIFVDPYMLQNIQNGQTASTITSTSLATNGTNTPSSNFSYSIWFYINNWNYRYGEGKVIFGRMGATSDSSNNSITGVSGVDPCPTVVLGPRQNNLDIYLSCYSGADQQPATTTGNKEVKKCSISNVPIQKWVNLTFSVYGRTMDIYMDGKLVRTCLLPGVAYVNNSSNIYVTPNGGFEGWTAKMQYYPNSLNPQDAWNIYTKGYSTWASMFNSYQVQLSLVENGTIQSSITI